MKYRDVVIGVALAAGLMASLLYLSYLLADYLIQFVKVTP